MSETKKELRGYLKAYSICRDQAAEIEKQIEAGEVIESVKDLLLSAKQEFEDHCRKVQIILGYLPGGCAARRVLTLRYQKGMSMKAIAKHIGYSVGYCCNVESEAIEFLAENQEIMCMIRKL